MLYGWDEMVLWEERGERSYNYGPDGSRTGGFWLIYLFARGREGFNWITIGWGQVGRLCEQV